MQLLADHLIHAWDLARAIGADEHLDEELVTSCATVFVHGVPETPAVWNGLPAAAGRLDSVAVALPGFDGVRPELARSWVTDAAGIGDPGFEWHDLARIWQAPRAGEDFWDQQPAARVQERAGVFRAFGVPAEPALDLAAHLSLTMADCILDLYRPAVDVGRQRGPDFAAIPAPGLVIIPGADPFLSAAPAARAAARAGAPHCRPRRARPLVDAAGPGPDGGRPARVLGDPGLTRTSP